MDFIINNDHGGYYYDLFYRFSLLIVFLIFLMEGWRRKYPISTLLLISAVSVFFAILGSKLSAYNLTDWEHFFETGSLPVPAGRSSLGALLLGWLGIGIAQRISGFKHSVLDLYILAIPVALIFQRAGCLLTGCCFGSPSNLPWAMQYGEVHGAWEHHYGQGLIEGISETSLAIHPIPIYFMLAYFLSMLIVLRFKNRFQANGNQALFGLILIFGFRFFIEFFRDPVTNHGLGETLMGIKQIQWLVLFILLLLGMIIRFRESRYQSTLALASYRVEKHFSGKLALLAIPPLGLLFLSDWFSFSEITVIHSHLVFAGLALAWVAFYRITHPRLRGITISILVLALFTMGQTYINIPHDSLSYQPKVFESFSFGFLEGRNAYDYSISNRIPGSHSSSDCGSSKYTYDHYDVGPNFVSGGFYYQNLKEVHLQKYNGWVLGGHLTQYNIRKNGENRRRISEIGVLINYRWQRPYHRLDLGFQAGGFEHINGKQTKSKIFPVFNFRFGPQEKLFFDGGIGSDFPFGTSVIYGKWGGGIGLPLFGAKYKAGLLFGTIHNGEEMGYYLSPYLPIGRFDLQPTFRFSKEEHMNSMGLTLRWHLDQERPFALQ